MSVSEEGPHLRQSRREGAGVGALGTRRPRDRASGRRSGALPRPHEKAIVRDAINAFAELHQRTISNSIDHSRDRADPSEDRRSGNASSLLQAVTRCRSTSAIA